MPRPSEGPKSPTPEEVDQMVDYVNTLITRAEKATAHPLGEKGRAEEIAKLERLVEILDWAEEQVNKRRLYSKKFQLKDKERTRLLKERLGEEYTNVLDEAKRKAQQKLSEEVANGKPDRDLSELLSE